MHLNSQLQQSGGFTPVQRVFGRTPELPIGAIGNPFFGYFMNQAEAHTAETRNLISAIYEIRHASSKADFRNKLDTTLIRRVRNAKMKNIFRGNQFTLWPQIAKNKEEEGKWVGPGIIIGRFGYKYALVHFRASYFEVDLEDMRTADSLFGIIGCGGTLTLHVPHTKSPIHYLVDAQTLVFLTKMRNGYLTGGPSRLD